MALHRFASGTFSERHGTRLVQYLTLVALVVVVAGGSDWLRASYCQSPVEHTGRTILPSVQLPSSGRQPATSGHGMASTHVPSAQAVSLRAVSVIASSLGDGSRLKRRLNANGLLESRSSDRQIRTRVNPVTCCSAVHSSLARNATLVGAKPSGTG